MTIVAMSHKTRHPSILALAARSPLIVREPQSSGAELFPQGAVLFLIRDETARCGRQ